MSRNARDSAIALALFAPLHALASWPGPALAPLALACWLGVSFGVLGLCDELGSARPLNRAGLVLYAAASVARVLMALTPDPELYVRAQLLFAFAILGALLAWSVALLHRPAAPRLVGALGAAAAGSALALSLAAHLAVGGAAALGFGGLFAALARPSLEAPAAVAAVEAILALWGVAAAALLFRVKLNNINSLN